MSALDKFAAAFEILIGHEQGYSNDPRDPGGATNLGVSLRFLKSTGLMYDLNRDGRVDAADIKLLSPANAAQIYRTAFWEPVRADELPPDLALLIFDAAVNNGVQQAIMWLQRVVGVKDDGHFGPATLAAVLAARDVPARFHARRVLAMTQMPGWPTYSRGWAIRLCQLPFQAQGME